MVDLHRTTRLGNQRFEFHRNRGYDVRVRNEDQQPRTSRSIRGFSRKSYQLRKFLHPGSSRGILGKCIMIPADRRAKTASFQTCLLQSSLVLVLWLVLQHCFCFGWEQSNPPIGSQAIVDGSLNACRSLSLDRTIAVGDRGLILLSSNGGKSWSVQGSRSEDTLLAIHFDDDQVGCIVGGRIEPLTMRSRGTVLLTNDGGYSWRSVPSALPRLAGIKAFSPKHWIAWGDWSVSLQTSLFETVDGGNQWLPVPIPCGHLMSVGILPRVSGPAKEIQLILVDRLGRCFSTSDRVHYQPIQLPESLVSPSKPLVFCDYQSDHWWLGGEGGILYRSVDGVAWERLYLPGNPRDHELFRLQSLAAIGNQVWIAGTPGNVLWSSSDRGRTWETRNIPSKSPIRSIHAFHEQLLIACGGSGTLLGTRNAGIAWSVHHRAAERLAALNIASISEMIGWDILAHIHHEARRTSGILVLHDQSIEQRSSYRPEQSQKDRYAAQNLGVAEFQTCDGFPVSANYGFPRSSDLNSYRAVGSIHTAPESVLLRRLILEIRMQRPDLVITDCPTSSGELGTKLSEAVQLAITWGARKDFRLFSIESGVGDEAWSVQRTLFRGTKSGGLQFHRSMLLKNTGTILGDVMASLESIVQQENKGGYDRASKVSYRTLGTKHSTLREPFESIPNHSQTRLVERSNSALRIPNILAASQWYSSDEFVPQTNPNPFVRDRSWEDRLLQAIRKIETSQRAAILFDMARKNRSQGNWNYWSSCLELILMDSTSSPYAEMAFRELMTYIASPEVNRMILSSLEQFDKRSVEETAVSTSVVPASSPFVKPNEIVVQHASFANTPRLLPVANPSEGFAEFRRLLGKFSEVSNDKRNDPEWGWLISARYRAYESTRSKEREPVDYRLLWPTLSNNLLAWQAVWKAEQQWYVRWLSEEKDNQNRFHPNRVRIASQRPHLDGIRNESTWDRATELVLRDPWGDDALLTKIKFAHDGEFLFLFAECKSNPSRSSRLEKRQRDSVRADQEQIRLRIDLDRDYCTWFELAWNRQGDASDQCNEMLGWNPDWFIAVAEVEDGWQTEIAIPFSELLPLGDSVPKHLTDWAVNVVHIRPGIATRSIAPAVSDRLQSDQWTLVHLDFDSASE